MNKSKDGKHQGSLARTRIHNACFYNPPPRAINCMAYNRARNKLVLARNDGSLEIWDMEHTPFLEKTTTRPTVDTSIDSIAWANKRLFSAGLNGEVIEWDVTTMRQQAKQSVTGNAIWCLAVNRQCTELALGTEEGYINIFNIENDEFQYKKLYDKQEGRVMCCGYDATGNYLVTGSINTLRIWNTQTGHAIQKMKLARGANDKSAVIWTLQVLDDFSIIAGDSRGCITVYDGFTGDYIEAHQVLKADILTLHVNESGDTLVCSGVEPVIRIYAKTKIKRDDTTLYRWVKCLQRAVHNYDVKTLLCISEDRIVSGSVDGYLGISYITKMKSTISRHGPFLQYSCATIASGANLLLLRYPDYLECWRLGVLRAADAITNNTKDFNRSKILPLETAPEKLFQIRSKNDEPILCATISPDGKKICYSNSKEIRLFNCNVDDINTDTDNDNEGILMPIRNIPSECSQSMSHICYSHDSEKLFLLSRSNKQLLIFKHLTHDQENDLTLLESVDLGKQFKGCIIHFTLSSNSQSFAVADDKHTIAVWNARKGQHHHFEHLMNLPRYDAAATTAIALNSHLPRIVVAFSDSRIIEYDLESARYTCWSDASHIVSNTETHCITQILLDDRRTDIIILQNDGYLFALEKYMPQNDDSIENAPELTKKSRMVRLKDKDKKDREMLSLRLKFNKSYEHLLCTNWLSREDLVTVSVNHSLFVEQLPPAFMQKKYGLA